MRIFFDLSVLLLIACTFFSTHVEAKDFVIYSIAQDIPMGNKDEVIRKNFYVDMGSSQGIKKGSVLDVYRVVSVLDPYESKKRFNHRVKIGEVKILHAEDSSAIGTLNKMEENEETPVFEIGKLMIGDIVQVKVK